MININARSWGVGLKNDRASNNARRVRSDSSKRVGLRIGFPGG